MTITIRTLDGHSFRIEGDQDMVESISLALDNSRMPFSIRQGKVKHRIKPWTVASYTISE